MKKGDAQYVEFLYKTATGDREGGMLYPVVPHLTKQTSLTGTGQPLI